LPIPIFAYAIYLLLEQLKIFRSSAIRAILGILMASTVVFFFRLGTIMLWGGVAGILILKIKDWPGRTAGLGLFILIMTQVWNLNILNASPSVILFLIFLGASLLVFIVTQSWKMRALDLIILWVFYFIVISYLLPHLPTNLNLGNKL